MTPRFAFILAPILLVASNIFMTYAWYGHLKDFKSKPLWIAIGVSWLVAFWSIACKCRQIESASNRPDSRWCS